MKKLNLTKKFLYKEYIVNKKTISQIAKQIGCGYGTVHRYLNIRRIQIRTHSESMKGKYIKEHNLNWKGNQAIKRKTYYCIDCDKEVNWLTALQGQGRCITCSNKGKHNPNYKHGKKKEKQACTDCKNIISSYNNKTGLCKKCYYKYIKKMKLRKGKNNPMYGKKCSQVRQILYKKLICVLPGKLNMLSI